MSTPLPNPSPLSEYTIRQATAEEAPEIGRAVFMAIGDEPVAWLASNGHTPGDVERLFASLASRPDTQYSYLNTLVAIDRQGKVAGVCISYDGAGLYAMREHFFEAARHALDQDLQAMTDETDAEEWYLDTLAVWPEYRGQGIARRLIEATRGRAAESGKPLGLLVDKDNDRARHLYESCGFKMVGERPFGITLMDHLQVR
ncbi:MAG: GNAT family N-acetyltransferase [Bacteroidales bacterium]|nr:GNAT family N-acetyltransferase [Bacteroidales bacterium]